MMTAVEARARGRHLSSTLHSRVSAPATCAVLNRCLDRGAAGEPPDLARFADLAAGLQARTEVAILALARRLFQATGEHDLVYAGGLALNCLANARLERDGPFRSMFMLGAAHDAGTAIGAALEIARAQRQRSTAQRPSAHRALSPFLGASYDDAAIDAAIARAGLRSETIDDPCAAAAAMLAEGRVVGWFQGRMEFGPRALGGRSLLADPRSLAVRDIVNRRIKHREPYRPFGASILAEHASDLFQIPGERSGAALCRDLMMLAYPVRPERAGLIPAVLHHDGTCRLQLVNGDSAPLFHTLIAGFLDRTGVPLVLNTSFNDHEPLVATPDDALNTFARTPIDAIFLGSRLVRSSR